MKIPNKRTQGNGESNITVRQKKFVEAVVRGESYRDATRKAGYLSPDYGSVLLKQPNIQTALQAYMHKAGITDEMIARKLKEGLNAKTVPKSEGGKRYDDQFVRKQFLDVILRIRGDYAPERFEAVNKQITLVIDNKMLEALKDSKAIDAEEVQYLEHTPIVEIDNGVSRRNSEETGEYQSGERETDHSREVAGETDVDTVECGEEAGS